MSLVNRLVRYRRYRIVQELLGLLGVDIPRTVVIGKDFQLEHRGFGTVIHPDTTIGDRVRIYHGVTIGRADAHVPREASPMEGITIENDVVICAGAVVLGGAGRLVVGAGTILGANAVLTSSTGINEIWAGVPARRIGFRR